MSRILIKNTLFLTFMDDGYTALQINNKDILIEDGYIKRVAYHIEESDCEVIDGKGKLTIPGFVNARSRALASVISKGITEDVNCDAYGNTPIYHRVNPFINLALRELDDAELKAILSLALYEAIESGTTTLLDQGTGRDVELFLELCEEYGLRTVAAPMLMSTSELPEGDKKGSIHYSWEENENIDKKIFQNWQLLMKYSGGRVRAAVGTAGTDLVSDPLFGAVKKLADETNSLFMMPFCETKKEIDATRERFQSTPAERLIRHGLCGKRTILGGAVYADDDELDRLRGTGVHIAHCPQEAALDGVFSRMVAPLSRHLNTGLGTGRCSVNLLEQLKVCALIGKLQFQRRYKVRGMYVYFAATEAGAAMMDDRRIGRLEEGQKADLITLNIDDPHHMPFQLPLTDLLYASRTGDVQDVIVDGRILKKDGRVLTIDRARVMEQAGAALDHLWACVMKTDTY